MVEPLTLGRLADTRRRSRAMDAWTDLQTLRSVAFSLASGVDQGSIARSLGISQPAVSKLARRARAVRDLNERTPREVILERAIGIIGDGEMIRELRSFTYTLGRLEDAGWATEPEAYVPGLRDQLEDAAGQGLLSKGEFEELTAGSGG